MGYDINTMRASLRKVIALPVTWLPKVASASSLTFLWSSLDSNIEIKYHSSLCPDHQSSSQNTQHLRTRTHDIKDDELRYSSNKHGTTQHVEHFQDPHIHQIRDIP